MIHVLCKRGRQSPHQLRPGLPPVLALAVILLASSLATPLAALEYLNFKSALARFLPGSGSVSTLPFTISDAEQLAARKAIGQDRRVRAALGGVYIGRSDSQLDGVVYVDHVIGRTEYITYGLALDGSGRVRDVAIMVYREPIGGEVRKFSWLNQFIERDFSTPFRLKKGIKNIAGATLSCRGVTERIRLLLTLHQRSVQPRLSQWLIGQEPAPLGKNHEADIQQIGDIVGNALLRIVSTSADAPQVLAAAKKLDATWSSWSHNPTLASLYKSGTTKADANVLNLFRLSKKLYHLTGGYFDPSVRPLLDHWWLAHRHGTMPEAADLQRIADKLVSWDKVSMQDESVSLTRGMRLDFGGIRKGAILDELTKSIRTDTLLDFGGSTFKAIGSKSWAIDIVNPDGGEDIVHTVTLPANSALAVSGGKRRSWTVHKQQRSTIINPHDGQPAPADHAAIVIAPSAAEADAIATAACLMSLGEVEKLVAKHCHLGIALHRKGSTQCFGAWPNTKQ